MVGLFSLARTVFRYSTFYNRGFLRPKVSPTNSLIQSPSTNQLRVEWPGGIRNFSQSVTSKTSKPQSSVELFVMFHSSLTSVIIALMTYSVQTLRVRKLQLSYHFSCSCLGFSISTIFNPPLAWDWPYYNAHPGHDEWPASKRGQCLTICLGGPCGH